MPIEYKKTVAVLSGQLGVEEAEPLLAWLMENPKASVNLKGCEHMHTSILQTLIYCSTPISLPPTDETLVDWLRTAKLLSED